MKPSRCQSLDTQYPCTESTRPSDNPRLNAQLENCDGLESELSRQVNDHVRAMLDAPHGSASRKLRTELVFRTQVQLDAVRRYRRSLHSGVDSNAVDA